MAKRPTIERKAPLPVVIAAPPVPPPAPALPAANPHRGEISVELSGIPYVLRPDFDAVSAIEQQLGSVTDLMRRVVKAPTSLTMDELATVVTEGIKAYGRERGTAEANSGVATVKRMIFNAGIPSVLPAVTAFLIAAVTGGQKPGNV